MISLIIIITIDNGNVNGIVNDNSDSPYSNTYQLYINISIYRIDTTYNLT